MKLKQRYERKTVNVSDIKTDPSNPNVMNSKQKKALEESIKRYGYVQEIIIDKKTSIIADGEHRLEQLKDQGIQEIEVIAYPFKDDTDRRIFRQTANKLRGSHDESRDAEEFKKILQDTDMEDFVKLTAISEQEILNILNKDNEQDKIIPDSEVDHLGKLTVTCPKCGHKFEKRRIN